MSEIAGGNNSLNQAGRPLRCWSLALLSGWVTMVFTSSVLVVLRDVPNAMTRSGFGSPGWIAASWRVADEMAPTAKLLLVAIFAALVWLGERWLPTGAVELHRWQSFLRDIAISWLAMMLTLALVPTDLSRGFGVGLTGARFDPVVLPLYLGSAALGAVIYTISLARCRIARGPSTSMAK